MAGSRISDHATQHRRSHPRRATPLPCDFALYCERNLVERFFNKLKHFRRIATRYDKLARNFLAALVLASSRLWMRAYESTT